MECRVRVSVRAALGQYVGITPTKNSRQLGAAQSCAPCNNFDVPSGRLTSDELDWLLQQEARGAAKSLQSDITELLAAAEQDRPSANLLLTDAGATLLGEGRDSSPDDFFSAESTREPPTRARSRRGRIDLAALLYDLAPQCRLAMEPGAGTEVFGNEAELYRALQLMLLQNPIGGAVGSCDSEVEIRREDDWIRVSVELGPDVGVIDDTERRWLHRVATKHGGRFELRGNVQCLLLPADASTHAEVEALQKELEQAQMLGEAYARELASVFSGQAANDAVDERTAGAGAAAMRRFATALLPVLNDVQRELRTVAPAVAPLIPLGDLLIQLTQLEATDDGTSEQVAADDLLRAAGGSVQSKASRRGVDLQLEAETGALLNTPGRRLELALRCALDFALHCAEQGAVLHVSARHDSGRWRLRVEEPNTRTPSYAELATQSPALVIADGLAAELGATLRIADSGRRLDFELSS